jgi:hypothetical protein
MSINYYARCASRNTINPKENKKKNGKKKEKRKPLLYKGARIGMQGFWKKNTTSFIL